jgi:hypothetical protein
LQWLVAFIKLNTTSHSKANTMEKDTSQVKQDQMQELDGVTVEALIGQMVMVIAARYIYSGKLVAFGHDAVWLAVPEIVYETGPFSDKKWKDAQRLPVEVYRIERSAIEGLGPVNR